MEACEIIYFQDLVLAVISTCDNLAHVFIFENNQLDFLNSLPGHLNKIKAIEIFKN